LAEPNLIPLTASTVRQIVEAIEPFAFERLYGAWWGKARAHGCEDRGSAVGSEVYRGAGEMIRNLFDIPAALPNEVTDRLIQTDKLRIERIVSYGQASPEGFWYDQDGDEWVIVLKGAARLRFESNSTPLELKPGDFIHIAAHVRHRVEWTAADEPTVWLAVHY